MPFIHSIVAKAVLAVASVVFLVASASVAPARAADVKLQTERYTIPSGDQASTFTSATSIRLESRRLRLTKSCSMSMARLIRPRPLSTCRSRAYR